MNVEVGKKVVAGGIVLLGGLLGAAVATGFGETETKKVYLPGPTVTEVVNRPFTVPVPGPTVTKEVVVTKTARPPIPKEASRSNERKTSRELSRSPREAAKEIFGHQYSCAAALISRESGWRVTATNSSSGAYGLPQALPGSKMASAGADWRTNPVTQLRWMKAYVDSRYGGICAAWNFWQSHNYY